MNSDSILQKKIQEIAANYDNDQLKELLAEYGLDRMPFNAHTKSILIKKVAKKMLDIVPGSVASAGQDPTTTQSSTNLMVTKQATNKVESSLSTDTGDIQKDLVAARESLSSCISDSNKTHYAVCIPGLDNTVTVHSDFREVLKIMKEHKSQNPRMLSFPCLADAETFSNNHTANEVCEGTTIKSNFPQEKAEVETGEIKLFSSLTTPQINEFRLQLEKGNMSTALECLLANPRYLIGNGDMPTILKEGPRYNALHASVMAGQLESCRLIMEMVSNVEYLKRMYGTQKRAEENSKRLIDLYLNTPDKIAHKTPLHFASEKGLLEIVAFLVSFKACIRNFNKHIVTVIKEGDKQYEKRICTGQTPEEIACARYSGPNQATVKARIISLIQGGTCYVPLIRSDTTGPYAKVGDPYSPTSPYRLVSEIEEVFRPAPATTDPNLDMKDFRNMKVWAFAGPMSPQEANDFKREWKSPRLKRHDQKENLKIKDGDRGFEHFGRELAQAHSVTWQEYWPFLDAFADLCSEDGLEKLELFFQKQQVLILMQTLLRGEALRPAAPYHVSPAYILSPDSDESSGENDIFVSGDNADESDSGGEKEVDDEEPVPAAESVKENLPTTSTNTKLSGGMLSSLWSGFARLKSYLSPGKSGQQKNTSNSAVGSKSKSEQELSKHANNNDSESEKSTVSKPGDHLYEAGPISGGQSTEGVRTGSGTSEQGDNSAISVLKEEDQSNIDDPNTASAAKSSSSSSSTKYKDTSVSESTNFASPKSSEGSGNVSDSKKDIFESENNVHSESQTPEPGSAPVLASEADINICESPDKWTYRSSQSPVESPDKTSPIMESALSPISPPLTDPISTDSPVTAGSSSIKIRGRLHREKPVDRDTPESPLPQDPDLTPDNSFNTKMNAISQGLEQFSFLSPNTTSSLSTSEPNSETTSSDRDDFETVSEPSIHVFTGKLWSQFSTELSSRKLISTDSKWMRAEDARPTLLLRQAADKETVLADVFLPELEGALNTLSDVRGPILDEETHKQAIKHVWVNFIAAFPSTFEAKRMSFLAREDIVRAVVEGIPEAKDTFGICSSKDMDCEGLKELFLKCHEDLEEARDSLIMEVKVIRASTLPKKEVYVCGTIPTKVDADVYHTLNKEASQLVRSQSQRFPLVHQWFEQMDRSSRDFISSLPSPSRVLRLEKRERPPISPLVKSQPYAGTRSKDLSSSPVTSKDKTEDPVIRTLFASGNELDSDE